MSPVQIRLLFGMIEPLLRWLAGMQGVGEEPDSQTERKQNDNIQDCEKDTRLEVTDLSTDALPSFPDTLQQTGFGQGSTSRRD